MTRLRNTPRTGYPFLDEPVERGAVLALAHRGGALHPDVIGLENTMRAFESAVALGYQYLETDVHATKDGELLTFHDANLDRVTDRVGALADHEYADVAAALVGGQERIPRLVDLLEAFPDARFNVDVKAPAGVEPLVELIARTGVERRILVGSFTERVLRSFRRRMATRSSVPVATSCGLLASAGLTFLPAGRLVPTLVRDTGVALQVPHRFRGRVLVVDGAFVRRAHAAGRHVHVWTLDDRAEIEAMLDLGVDGIFTDRTDVLREVLVERGLWDGGGCSPKGTC